MGDGYLGKPALTIPGKRMEWSSDQPDCRLLSALSGRLTHSHPHSRLQELQLMEEDFGINKYIIISVGKLRTYGK